MQQVEIQQVSLVFKVWSQDLIAWNPGPSNLQKQEEWKENAQLAVHLVVETCYRKT